MTTSAKPLHSVLQLHGGGALVLSQILKCAALESLTGKPIRDMFDTVIADSAGAIVALCLQKISARELLSIYLSSIHTTLPDLRFVMTQPLVGHFRRAKHGPSRFDRDPFEQVLLSILGDTNLSDVRGNMIIGAVNLKSSNPLTYAYSFEKVSTEDGHTHYSNNGQDRTMLLKDIAMATSAIPGIMSPHNDQFADRITSQHPYPHLHRLQQIHPDHQLVYIQAGSIISLEIVERQQESSFVVLAREGIIQAHMTKAYISDHFNRVAGLIDPHFMFSLTTYAENGMFSPTDNSQRQRIALITETLDDLEKRSGVFMSCIERLGFTPICTMPDAIGELLDTTSPFMKNDKGNDEELLGQSQKPSLSGQLSEAFNIFALSVRTIIANEIKRTGSFIATQSKRAYRQYIAPEIQSMMRKCFPNIEQDQITLPKPPKDFHHD